MQDASRTQLMARIVGPFMLIFGASIIMRAPTFPLFVPAFFQDGVLVYVTGAFTLAIGLTMIAAHQRWSTLPAIVISVFAWITTIRGVVLLVAPTVASAMIAIVDNTVFVMIAGAIAALLGAWLTIVGWFSKSAS